MGSKGGNTTTTNQTQTYAPAGAGYVQNALQQGQNAASLPFNIPQAPVAGFNQDQQQAFQNVNNAQGMAQPYFNQANQYFQQSAQGPNVSQFFNPYAGAVTSQLNNIFGQQQSQNTGQLTQAAGGVGADRIAVGQSQLANQQGLAAGQTLAGLYAPSLQAAQNQQNILQSAGYGTAALGSQAQNAALSGAQAQLGTGGLQQQLSQAQLNSPYQQQLAQAAFPYQQAQFLAGITGSLAPGLGGTSYGQGQTTTPAPSLWSQLLGGGAAATGILGQTGAFGSNGYLTGNKGSGGGGGNYGSQPLTGQDAWQNSQLFPGLNSAARGGAIHPYAEGGGVSDEPIDVAPQSIIPTNAQTPHIQDHIPQLNLNPPQQQSGGGGGGGAGGLGTVLSIAKMFMARGGAANPYFFKGGDTDVINPDDPFQMPGQDKVQDWRNSVDADMASGEANSPKRLIDGSDQPSPLDTANWPYGPVGGPSDPAGAVNQFAGNAPRPQSQGQALNFAGDGATTPAPSSPYSPPAAAPQSDDGTGGFNNFIKSPWAALTAAGLGIMGGTSPYAGVNIGQGAQQGLKMLEQQREGSQKDETIKQATRRLDLEAKHYEEQAKQANRPYEQLTAAQRENADLAKQREDLAEKQFNRPYEELTKAEQARLEETRRQHDLARVPQGFRQKEDGSLEPISGGPHSPEQIRAETEAKRGPAMSDEDLRPMVDTYKAGNTTGVLSTISRGTQGPQNIQRFWHLLAQDLTQEGATGKDLAAAKANFMAQSAGLRVAAQRESQIETAVNEAKGTFPEVLRTSALLPRGEFTPVNEALNYFRSKTGSTAQRSYGAAIQAAITAYSQAMNRTGANSVFAQQHAEQMLAKADGPAAIKSTIDQLNIEMGIAQRAPEETRQAILNRILGIKTDSAQPPAAAGATAPPAALPDAARAQLTEGHITTFGNGQKWTLQNGQPKQVQ